MNGQSKGKLNLHVPVKLGDGRIMEYILVREDGTYCSINRIDFFVLIANNSNPNDHVIPDFEAALVYYCETDQFASIARSMTRDVETEKKRLGVKANCPYRRKSQCPCLEITGCSECESYSIGTIYKPLSLDGEICNKSGESACLRDMLVDEQEMSTEEKILAYDDRDQLRMGLSTLTEMERNFILMRFEDKTRISDLTRKYGLNYNEIRNMTARILKKLRRAIQC